MISYVNDPAARDEAVRVLRIMARNAHVRPPLDGGAGASDEAVKQRVLKAMRQQVHPVNRASDPEGWEFIERTFIEEYNKLVAQPAERF